MLEALFAPKTIAVFGGPEEHGPAYALVRNLLAGDFKGDIVPVHAECQELLGIPCSPELRLCSEEPSLALIATLHEDLKQAVEQAVDAGVSAVAVFTDGFDDEMGAGLRRDIVEICRTHGVRLLGPDSLGVVNRSVGLNASLISELPPRGAIAVFSQSSALTGAIVDHTVSGELGISRVVDLGEHADITVNDLLAVFADDENTGVIAGYMESIGAGDRFIKTAERVASKKPVVILKTGTTQAGAMLASARLGESAGADLAYGAAFKRAGIIRAETFEQLLDFSRALAVQPLPAGNRVAVVTNSYGAGVMAVDALERADLALTDPNNMTTGDNPVNLKRAGGAALYTETIAALDRESEVDSIVVVIAAHSGLETEEIYQVLAQSLSRVKKTALVVAMEAERKVSRRALSGTGVPDFPTPARGIAALGAMWQYASWRRRPPRVVARFPVNRRRVERIITRHMRTGRESIGEIPTKEILGAYGFNVPEGALAKSSKEALEIAEQIGFPVALKLDSPDIRNKSAADGVKLWLTTEDQLRDAFDLMVLRTKTRFPQARLEGAYVEKMCGRGREVILGMNRDAQFGPMLMFGLGGIFVEVMKDVAFHLAPITAEEAMQMLAGTRSYEMLTGASDREGVDVSAIALGLQKISQLATDFPEIQEMDINPYLVGEVGAESVVVSARITLKKGGEMR